MSARLPHPHQAQRTAVMRVKKLHREEIPADVAQSYVVIGDTGEMDVDTGTAAVEEVAVEEVSYDIDEGLESMLALLGG